MQVAEGRWTPKPCPVLPLPPHQPGKPGAAVGSSVSTRSTPGPPRLHPHVCELLTKQWLAGSFPARPAGCERGWLPCDSLPNSGGSGTQPGGESLEVRKDAKEILLQKHLGDRSWPDPGPSRTAWGGSAQVLMDARASVGDNMSCCQQELPQNLVPTPALAPHRPPSSPIPEGEP